MIWLSPLLRQYPSLWRPAADNHDDRCRRGKGRRRVMTLERLEHRTLLSDVTATFAAGILTVAGDSHNDSFSITEIRTTLGGTVTVASTAPNTTINGTSVPFTTLYPVTGIVVTLPGTNNLDKVSLIGPGRSTATTVKDVTVTVSSTTALVFRANGVDNSGKFTLTTGGQINATADNSTFNALTIDQSNGCCPASVELGNDIIPGSVKVLEGKGKGDSIALDNGDKFGSTWLAQTNGDGDSVSVSNVSAKDMSIYQGDGTGGGISVDTLTLSLISFGLYTSQGTGDGDTATVNAVTAPSTTPPPNNPQFVPTVVVNQGNGNGDSTTVSNSDLPGDMSINQGGGNGDYAAILSSHAGFTLALGPYVIDFFGNATVHQGNGYNDVAVLDGGEVVNDVYISQGDSIGYPDCVPGLGDEVHINNTAVTSDIIIQQGSSQALGNYLVTTGDTGPVTAGGATTINQSGANNTVVLGGDGSSFTTDFLDVYTGAGGGGFVPAMNTTVIDGSYYSNDFVIDGGGDGNTFQDLGGNSGVTISGNYNAT